jgi:hypothetical protein
MIRNEINNVRVTSVGYNEELINLTDGDETLPGGFYMELEVENDVFVIPVAAETVNAIQYAIKTSADMSSEVLAESV